VFFVWIFQIRRKKGGFCEDEEPLRRVLSPSTRSWAAQSVGLRFDPTYGVRVARQFL